MTTELVAHDNRTRVRTQGADTLKRCVVLSHRAVASPHQVCIGLLLGCPNSTTGQHDAGCCVAGGVFPAQVKTLWTRRPFCLQTLLHDFVNPLSRMTLPHDAPLFSKTTFPVYFNTFGIPSMLVEI